MFHTCRRHDIKTTAAVFCLSSSRSAASSTLYSRQSGVSSCRCQHVERPSVPHRICTVTRGLQTASRDFPLLSFLPGHLDMTHLSLFIIIIVFSGIMRKRCNNWHYLGHVEHVDDDDNDDDDDDDAQCRWEANIQLCQRTKVDNARHHLGLAIGTTSLCRHRSDTVQCGNDSEENTAVMEGRSKPDFWTVGSGTKWELTTGADLQLSLHWLLMWADCNWRSIIMVVGLEYQTGVTSGQWSITTNTLYYTTFVLSNHSETIHDKEK